jgi:DNA-binding MarR family transcriptional regulator
MEGTSGVKNCATDLADCVCFNFRKASRVITKVYDDALRPSGLTTTQFSILSVLGIIGPVNILKLAGQIAMERTTLTRNLRLLEKKGLIEIRPGQDQRTRIINNSTKGNNAMASALPLWSEVQARVTGKIGTDKWSGMLGELQEIVETLKAG